jgi:hypothetical protein
MDINIKETNEGQKCIIVDDHRYRIDITLKMETYPGGV